MANTAIVQASVIYKTLSDFFKSEGLSAASADASPDPTEFRDFTGVIDYSELLRHALMDQKANPSLRNGATIDTIHHASAAIREYDMCTKNKLSYTLSRVSDANSESIFYINRGLLMDAQLRGRMG